MLAAIDVVRRLGPRALVLAVPVAPPDTLALLAPRVDQLVCLLAPPDFEAVGQWYEAFEQTGDREVQALLAAAWNQHGQSRSTDNKDSQPTGGAKHEPDDQDNDDERYQP